MWPPRNGGLKRGDVPPLVLTSRVDHCGEVSATHSWDGPLPLAPTPSCPPRALPPRSPRLETTQHTLPCHVVAKGCGFFAKCTPFGVLSIAYLLATVHARSPVAPFDAQCDAPPTQPETFPLPGKSCCHWMAALPKAGSASAPRTSVAIAAHATPMSATPMSHRLLRARGLRHGRHEELQEERRQEKV